MEPKQINKIKYNPKTSEVIIEYDIQVMDEIKVTLKSEDRPLLEFIEQFKKLVPYVEQICQFPEGFCDMAEVRGISLSYSHEVMGAVITCLIPLETANGPMVVNTPHIPSGQYNDGGSAPTLPIGCVNVINELIIQAERYIDGERDVEPDAQMEIPFDDVKITISDNNGNTTPEMTMAEFHDKLNSK